MVEELIAGLYEQNAFQLGEFTLKSGVLSPIYIDIRTLASSPKILVAAAKALCDAIAASNIEYDYVVGVPYGAMSLATIVSCNVNKPLLFKRKEAKSYGTKKLIEGIFEPGKKALIIEDVITTGSSILETVEELRKAKLHCEHAVCVLDRESTGADRLRADGIAMHSLISLTSILDYLVRINMIDQEKKMDIQNELKNPRFPASTTAADGLEVRKEASLTGLYCCEKHRGEKLSSAIHCTSDPKTWSLESRKPLFTKSPLNKRVVDVMLEKHTNLCLSVDFTTADKILALAEEVHPFICALKIHHDATEGFSFEFAQKLHDLGQKHGFVIFEDRKYADIGKVTEAQVSNVAQWANVVTLHSVAGVPSLQPLTNLIGKDNFTLAGCLLVAEMSSKMNLTHCECGGYLKGTVALYEAYPNLVAGFICQKRCHDDPAALYWTPGVNLSASSDDAGQQWRSVRRAIVEDRCDIIIVGRGITAAADPIAEAKRYAEAGWQALVERNA